MNFYKALATNVNISINSAREESNIMIDNLSYNNSAYR